MGRHVELGIVSGAVDPPEPVGGVDVLGVYVQDTEAAIVHLELTIKIRQFETSGPIIYLPNLNNELRPQYCS